MAEHKVVEIRATGRTPEAVTAETQSLLDKWGHEGWELTTVQPITTRIVITARRTLFR